MSPLTVAEVSALPMCYTVAPPASRTPEMAVPMLPVPKMVAVVISPLPGVCALC